MYFTPPPRVSAFPPVSPALPPLEGPISPTPSPYLPLPVKSTISRELFHALQSLVLAASFLPTSLPPPLSFPACSIAETWQLLKAPTDGLVDSHPLPPKPRALGLPPSCGLRLPWRLKDSWINFSSLGSRTPWLSVCCTHTAPPSCSVWVSWVRQPWRRG